MRRGPGHCPESLPGSCLLLAPSPPPGASSKHWNVPVLTTESQAGREGEDGFRRLRQTFLGKNKGKFQALECRLRARPDVLIQRAGFPENGSCLLPAPKLEGGEWGWASGPSCPHLVSTDLLNMALAAHSNSPCAVYKLPTFLKCQHAFLSLPTQPPGVPTPDPGSRGTFSALDQASHLLRILSPRPELELASQKYS